MKTIYKELIGYCAVWPGMGDWPNWDTIFFNGHNYIHNLFPNEEVAWKMLKVADKPDPKSKVVKVKITIEELEPISYMNRRKER